MRSLALVGCVLVLAACTRVNGAFDPDASGGSAGEEGTTRTDGADDPEPGTGSASGSTSGVDGTTTSEPPSGSTSESTTTPVEGTTTMGGGEEGPATGEPQDCCLPAPGPGCSSNGELEDAVCAARPECCAVAWDQQCVELVALLGFDGCGVATDACCSLSDFPGCELTYVEQCVCDMEPSCCGFAWHPYCVFLAASEQCHAPCEPPSDCCFPHPGLGCDNPEIEGCVCKATMSCCSVGWGESCASQAVECNASACGG